MKTKTFTALAAVAVPSVTLTGRGTGATNAATDNAVRVAAPVAAPTPVDIGNNDPATLAAVLKDETNTLAKKEGMPWQIKSMECLQSALHIIDCHSVTDIGITLDRSYVVSPDGKHSIVKAGQ